MKYYAHTADDGGPWQPLAEHLRNVAAPPGLSPVRRYPTLLIPSDGWYYSELGQVVRGQSTIVGFSRTDRY